MEDLIYSHFTTMCYHSSLDEIQEVIEKYKIDLNYDDDSFIEIICFRNNIELLKLFVNNGCKINEDILSLVSSMGYLELVKYLVSIGIKYDNLIKTSAYNTYPEIKDFYDGIIKKECIIN